MARSGEKLGTRTGAGLALAVGETVGGAVGRTDLVVLVVGTPGSADGADDDDVHPHVSSAAAATPTAYRLMPRP
jgi:hypothetical protein